MSLLSFFIIYSLGVVLWGWIIAPMVDDLVLRLIRIFRPSFRPYESLFQFTPLGTERQVVERVVYRTSLILVHLFLIWPLLIISLLSLLEGILWTTGLNALKYAPQFWMMSEVFMAVDILFYHGDMVKSALMLGETRQLELVNLTRQLYNERWAPCHHNDTLV